MTEVNRFGLKRYIPASTRREVRQRVGFGCIFDGNMIIDYEHFAPEFKNCIEHHPDGITLLCGRCHDKKNRGRLDAAMVAAQNRTPVALTTKQAWDSLDWEPSAPLHVFVGTNHFQSVASIVTVHGLDILRVDPPERPGAPFQLSGSFFDDTSRLSLKIVRNEIRVRVDNWDVEETANRIVVRQGSHNVTLAICHEPPNVFKVERLKMRYRYHKIELDPQGNLAIEMTASPIGPHFVGAFGGQQAGPGTIGLHIPAGGGVRFGNPRPTDGSPLSLPPSGSRTR